MVMELSTGLIRGGGAGVKGVESLWEVGEGGCEAGLNYEKNYEKSFATLHNILQ